MLDPPSYRPRTCCVVGLSKDICDHFVRDVRPRPRSAVLRSCIPAKVCVRPPPPTTGSIRPNYPADFRAAICNAAASPYDGIGADLPSQRDRTSALSDIRAAPPEISVQFASPPEKRRLIARVTHPVVALNKPLKAANPGCPRLLIWDLSFAGYLTCLSMRYLPTVIPIRIARRSLCHQPSQAVQTPPQEDLSQTEKFFVARHGGASPLLRSNQYLQLINNCAGISFPPLSLPLVSLPSFPSPTVETTQTKILRPVKQGMFGRVVGRNPSVPAVPRNRPERLQASIW